MNRGDGTFGDKANYPSVDGPYSVAIGDVNGDGLEDLATANDGNFPNREKTVSSVRQQRPRGFQPALQYTVGLGPQSVVLADVSGDGHPDLVTANTLANSVSVLLNPGDGSFVGRRDYATGRSPQQVAVGDVDGDGRLDLATSNYYSPRSRQPGDGLGAPEQRWRHLLLQARLRDRERARFGRSGGA